MNNKGEKREVAHGEKVKVEFENKPNESNLRQKDAGDEKREGESGRKREISLIGVDRQRGALLPPDH